MNLARSCAVTFVLLRTMAQSRPPRRPSVPHADAGRILRNRDRLQTRKPSPPACLVCIRRRGWNLRVVNVARPPLWATTQPALIMFWHLRALCRTMIDVQLAVARMR